VILVDANLLIYAATSSMSQHEPAKAWLDARLSGAAPVALPWPSLLAFLRIVSNPRLFERASSVADGWTLVRKWLAAECAWIPDPTAEHSDVLERLLRLATTPDLVSDAHLAALAIEHGLTLCSTDGDFARFPGLRWENPLAKSAAIPEVD
jgi:toxin-antitoxin system PIN domain toxin